VIKKPLNLRPSSCPFCSTERTLRVQVPAHSPSIDHPRNVLARVLLFFRPRATSASSASVLRSTDQAQPWARGTIRTPFAPSACLRRPAAMPIGGRIGRGGSKAVAAPRSGLIRSNRPVVPRKLLGRHGLRLRRGSGHHGGLGLAYRPDRAVDVTCRNLRHA